MTSMLALWVGALSAIGGPVTELAITPMAERTSVLITVDGGVQYRDFTMEGPHRLVVDIMGAENALPRSEWTRVDRGGVRSVRASQYSEDVVRIVLVLDGRRDYAVAPSPTGLRITLDNPGGAFEPWSSSGAAFDPLALQPAAERAQQQVAPQEAVIPPVTIRFAAASISEVIQFFAEYSGKSIIAGAEVVGTVTATIRDQPWDVALRQILNAQGLSALEDENGIIRVDQYQALTAREEFEPIVTRPYPISYGTAQEVSTQVSPLLSTPRGSITVATSTNTIIVSDIQRVHNAIQELIPSLDRPVVQVQITAKIIFVNRTQLDELGVRYELKDSRGNQLNALSPGGADFNGDGIITQDEIVEQGTPVVLLGGTSVAALGNAATSIGSPTLQLLSSLAIGRHQLVSFIDALQSVNLSDIQATPSVTTLDNQQATIFVGETTPIRTIDAGAQGDGAGTFPTAQVDEKDTGIILQATPHVTGNQILLELMVERSAAEIASSDVGFIFNIQRGTTRVIVEDGETTVIAGLTQSEISESRSGMPVLMDLPLLGRLFRVTRQNEIQRDLIILVTPHIVRPLN